MTRITVTQAAAAYVHTLLENSERAWPELLTYLSAAFPGASGLNDTSSNIVEAVIASAAAGMHGLTELITRERVLLVKSEVETALVTLTGTSEGPPELFNLYGQQRTLEREIVFGRPLAFARTYAARVIADMSVIEAPCDAAQTELYSRLDNTLIEISLGVWGEVLAGHEMDF